ncbi:MAG: hypothetical protein HY364_00200 [Candidatus Aenigmarchaeota archaeon]|nr:hypothetical protein [Candidatus Aenigmarchaeota archaeon]
MFWMLGTEKKPKPDKGPTTYAESSGIASPDYANKTAQHIAEEVRLRGYMHDQPGALVVAEPYSIPKRSSSPKKWLYATATGLALLGLGGLAYGINSVVNRNTSETPIVRTIEQPANNPILVGAPSSQAPLAQQATPIPTQTPLPTRPRYQPKGIMQREDKERGILIDCIQDCDPSYLDQSIVNAGKVADTLQLMYGDISYKDKQLVLEVKGKDVRMPLTPDLPYEGAIIFDLDNDIPSFMTACDEMSDFYTLNAFPAPLWLREGFSLYAKVLYRNPINDFSYVANLPIDPIDSRPYNKVKNNPELMFKPEYLDAHGTGITWVKGLEEDYGWRLPEFRGFIVKMHELSTEGHDTTKPEAIARAAKEVNGDDISPLMDLLKPGFEFDSHATRENYDRFIQQNPQYGNHEFSITYP